MARSRHRRVSNEPTALVDKLDTMRADFNIGNETRFRRSRTGIVATGSSADYHIRNQSKFFKAIEIARDIDRNDMVVGQAIDRFCDNVLPNEFTLDPETGDAELDKEMKARWLNFADRPENCDAGKRHTFHRQAWLTLRHTVVDGDVLLLPLKTGRLQAVEAHRLKTPYGTKKNVVHGVLLDENTAEPREYWVTKNDVDINYAPKLVNETSPYPAFNADGSKAAYHVYFPRRFSQSRGVTALAPIIDPVSMHDDLQFAKLVQAQQASCYSILEEDAFPDVTQVGGAPQGGEREEDTRDDGSVMLSEHYTPGMYYRARPGKKISGFSPSIPNAEFFQHATLILSIIAVNLKIPVAVLLLDPSNTNFSGWRGAIDQARQTFMDIQRMLVTQFYTPVYEWQVRRWMAGGDRFGDRLEAAEKMGVPIFQHYWKPPRWSYIEPEKDGKADRIRHGNTLSSARRIYAENGNDCKDIYDEQIEDRAYAIRGAKKVAAEINAEFPDDDKPISWMDLCPLPMAEGMQSDPAPIEEKPDPVMPAGGSK